MRRICLLFTVLLSLFTASAQTPPAYTSADIYLLLKKLNVLGSVLYVAAHPDDENTRLLAYLAKDRLYRTGYLSLTRGDGGQNLIGDDQGVDLGLIRTQELLSARRIDGAEQFFTRAYDFGFTKTTEEALQTWGKEKILGDVVWIIRKFQPDVIITRFPEDSRAGHGQHSGSAVLAREAFKAAADPGRFPEQLKYGVQPWQAKRIMWNTYNFGNTNATSEDQLKVDVGAFNPVLGTSYGEIAAESRSQHKSQGFGIPALRGVQLEYFTLTEGSPAPKDIIDDVNTTWSRVQGGERIAAQIDSIIKNYSLPQPELSVPALVNLYAEISKLPEGYWRTQKLPQIQDLIEMCSGLWLEATANTEFAVQGDSIRTTFSVNNRLGNSVQLRHISMEGYDTAFNLSLERNRNNNYVRMMYIPPSKPVTQPYWLKQKMAEGAYNVDEQLVIGKPENDAAYTVQFDVLIGGQPFRFVKPLRYKFTDPVKGELYHPLVVIPPVSVATEPAVVVFSKTKPKETVVLTVTANKNFNHYTAAISNRTSFHNNTQTDSNFTVSRGAGRQYSFSINRSEMKNAKQDSLRAFAQLKNGKEAQPASLAVTSIQYDHIPHIHYFYEDAVKVLNVDLKTKGKRIGYIEGAGDKVPAALEQMGYQVILLKERELTASYLRQFDAVITGVRAYNVHPYLASRYDALMDYVRDGGNLIVQYNTNNFVSTVTSRIGPYPFVVSRNRVTDERAPVKFLLPDHPVLNYPNKITEADFDGWIQERGVYYADQVNENYEMPLSMADPNEAEQKGSLIIASHGKGKFVYTGLVFFRELPAGVPGAYRLLANIIALNKKKGS